MLFTELSIKKEIIDACLDQGFETLTEIQERSITPLLEGVDLIGKSQTGSGKTMAFGIPVVENINPKNRRPQAIVLCPTRELALQVKGEIDKLVSRIPSISTVAVYGGDPIVRQLRALKRGVHIVVGTPGRIMDHIKRGTIDTNFLQTIVLDEADEMLNMGFRDDIETVLSSMPDERQMVLFSATMPKAIVEIAKTYQTDPVMIDIKRKALTTETIDQGYMNVNHKYKFEALTRLIEVHPAKLSLVFCNTKRKVDEVTDSLQAAGYTADKIHGDMKQEQRLMVLNKYKKGIVSILVATDVAARGIDIDDIDVVYNFDIPENEEYYVHRIGRTGRAGRNGLAFALVAKSEIRRIRNIERYIKSKIEEKSIPSIKNVNATQATRYLDDIKSTVDTEDLSEYHAILAKLIEDGYSANDIAAAIIKKNLVFKEDIGVDITAQTRGRDRGDRGRHDRGRNDRGGRDSKKDRRKNPVADGYKRLELSIGRKDVEAFPEIIRILTKGCNLQKDQIGNIDMYGTFTHVEIPDPLVSKATSNINGKSHKGRKLQLTEPKGGGASRNSGGYGGKGKGNYGRKKKRSDR